METGCEPLSDDTHLCTFSVEHVNKFHKWSLLRRMLFVILTKRILNGYPLECILIRQDRKDC
jgi:hypothetical protein